MLYMGCYDLDFHKEPSRLALWGVVWGVGEQRDGAKKGRKEKELTGTNNSAVIADAGGGWRWKRV